MKKYAALFAALFLGGILIVHAEKYKISVGEFTELSLNDNINVVYSTNPDSVGYVAFDTKPAYASYIMTNASNGKLRIELVQEAVGLKDLPTVYAYSTFLSKVVNSKEGTIHVRNIKPAAKISAELQGNGKIIVEGMDATTIDLRLHTGKGNIIASGSCTHLHIRNVGTGTIEADNVVAKEVNCRILGTGTVGCAPSEKLSVGGAGSGKVYYKGHPEKISVSKIGSIKVIPLDSAEKESENIEAEEPDETEFDNADDDASEEPTPERQRSLRTQPEDI